MENETKFYVVDAFTRSRFQGNPAGVVISPGPLTAQDMLSIAAELHLETAFLWPVESRERARGGSLASYSICYYTHVARIPLCGHDTIATGIVLAHRGEIAAAGENPAVSSRIIFKSDIGDLPIEIMGDGMVGMRQSLPQYDEPVKPDAVLAALGIPASKLTDHPCRVVSTGTPFLFVGVDSTRSLDMLTPDMPALTQALVNMFGQRVAGVYVWADDRIGRTQTIYGRCFAPGAGLPEDPVTGSASGALGAHLFDLSLLRGAADGTATMQTTQGRAMGRTGHVYVTLIAADRRVNSVSVAGHGVIVGEGTLYV